MTRNHPHVALFLAASAALAMTATPPTQAAAPQAAATGCQNAPEGLVENSWLGGSGTWSDATKWSQQVVPGLATRDYACLPTGSDVVVDASVTRIDLDLLDVDSGSRLTLQPGTALYVWGDQLELRSVVRNDAVLEVDGATLGGGGRLQVIGTVDVHRSTAGTPAVLSSRPVSSPSKGRKGLLEIADQGVLDVHGAGDVRLARKYVVSVRGLTRLRDSAGLVADHGTAFLLQEHTYGEGAGRLVIRNNRGFAEGRRAGIVKPSVFVNDGLIVKRDSEGTSRIDGAYRGSGRIDERTGDVVYQPPLPLTDGCGDPVACGADPTKQIPQTASLEAPTTDLNGPATLSITPLEGEQVPGALGVPMKVHATGLEATFADPAVIELHYDSTLFTATSPPPDPAKLVVGHADGPGTTYADVPSCAGREIPVGAFACLDVEASRTEGKDLVLVILTVDTSRWVAH
jgi:hypothetical protein